MGLLFTLLLTVLISLFALSLSIAAPLLIRPFYYLHIDALSLPQSTGFTHEQIKTAFDNMMDFCILGRPFGCGDLEWSEDGFLHFADCRRLFMLDFKVLGISFLLLLVCCVFIKLGLKPRRIFSLSAAALAPLLLLLSSAVLFFVCARDFDKAFVTFHHLFFPGRTNWIFDEATDQIILILPEIFFRNCAIFILACLVFICVLLLAADRKFGRR